MADPDDPFEWPVHPIFPNPGGQVDPADHVGRDIEYDRIVGSFQGQGALLTGDRRMGKTSMLNLVEERLGGEHVVVRLSAETEDFGEFAQRLLGAIAVHPRLESEARRWSLDIDIERFGCRVRRRSAAGDPVDESADDLFAAAASAALPGRLVLILDEITVLATELERSGPGTGLELFRTLKRARDRQGGPVMILSGSIGLHHAVTDRSCVNDLAVVPIGPLVYRDAVHLARCLLAGAGLSYDDRATVGEIVTQTNCIAFYMHHVVEDIASSGRAADAALVRSVVQGAIADPDDPWHLGHYEARLPTYFGDDARLVARILDEVAVVPDGLALDEIAKRMAMTEHGPTLSRDRLVGFVTDLERDHYLRRVDRAICFASDLLRRAWIRRRHL